MNKHIGDAIPASTPRLLRRLTRAYGTLGGRSVLGEAWSGRPGAAFRRRRLTQREVDYLMDQEWARTADDVLWRRSKQGLRVNDGGEGETAPDTWPGA